MAQGVSCGIDFGTSNSTCAISHGGVLELVGLEGQNPVLPSALFFANDGQITFGRAAIAAYIDGEEGRLMRGLKSVLGTALMEERTDINKATRTFQDILAVYIKNMKNKAEERVQGHIDNVVMGRPVHFHDDNIEADQKSEDMLRQIAHLVGFKNVEFQLEPIAAAYAHEGQIAGEKIALVVDLGGGTSDFTVMRLSSDRVHHAERQSDILATAGIRVGGTNFDKNLSMKSFMPYLGLGTHYRSEFDRDKLLLMPPRIYHDLSDWPLIHQAQTSAAMRETKILLRNALEPEKLERLVILQENQQGHGYLQAVEQAKIALTDVESYSAQLENLDFDFKVDVTRTEFVQSIGGLVHRIDGAIDACISQSGLTPMDIDMVIMTGGSSELPVINQMVQSKLPNATISKDNKFGSVGIGLAHNAAMIFGG